MSDAMLSVESVSKTFTYRPYARGTMTLKSALLDALLLRPRPEKVTVRAVQDVSFEVAPGEAFGLVGRNGAGKTTLLRLIAGVYQPDTGSVTVRGRMSMLLNLGASFHPDLSGYENAEVAALLNGMSKAEFLKSIKGITEFSELDGALDAPVRTYSSGMTLRLAFAVASSLNPKVLLVDEALAVGDQVFQQKCMDRIRELLASGTSLLVCSHDLVSLKSLCDRGLLLEGGAPQLLGSIDEVAKAYCERANAPTAR